VNTTLIIVGWLIIIFIFLPYYIAFFLYFLEGNIKTKKQFKMGLAPLGLLIDFFKKKYRDLD
jgi:hypothetical protein